MSKRKMKDSGVEWLGEIPAEWDVRRGKTFLRLLSRPVKVDDDIVTCFRDGEVTLRKNRREDGFTVALKECGYQGVEPGDLVVHGMDGFAGSIGISDSRGKASPVLNVMDTSEDKRYIMYYLRSLAMRDVFLALSTGIRVRSCDLRWSKLGDIQYLLPPLFTQRKIAAYLDVRCAKIDEMISDAKKTIEEYKAWKSSVIFEAVTGKCKIENGECKIGGWAMRESGVEWIGMIPEGWRVNRVKRIVRVENGSDPLTEGSIPVYGSGESSFKTCGEFKEGPTVLLGRKGATLHIPHYIEGRYWNVDTAFDVRMKGNDNLRWFYYLAISFDYKAYISKTTLPSMTQSNYNNMHVPHPPVTEQCAIAAFLDKKCAAIDRVISAKESLIADLEAYKKSLIFECVTGKMEVA